MKAERRYSINNVVSYILNIPSITKSGETVDCVKPVSGGTDKDTKYIQLVEREFPDYQSMLDYVSKSNPSVGEVLVVNTQEDKSRWIVSPSKIARRLLSDQKVRSLVAKKSPIICRYENKQSSPTIWLLDNKSNKLFPTDFQFLEDNYISIYWGDDITGTLFVF